MSTNKHDEQQLNKTLDMTLLKRLLRYTKPYILLILFSFILLIILSFIDLVKPLIIKTAMNDFISNKNKIGLQGSMIFYFTLVIVGFFINYAQTYCLNWTGQKIIYTMRQELFSHIQHLSLSFFDKTPVGRLVTRVTNDMENLNELYTEVLVTLFKDIFMLVGIVFIMLKLDVGIALVCFLSFPIIIINSLVFKNASRKAYREVRVKLAAINSSISENISGMKVIQIFHRESYKYDEFYEVNASHRKASFKELQTFAIFRPTMDLIYNFALALLIWFAGGSVLKGSLDFGTLYAFITYIDQFFKPINDLAEKFNIMQGAMASSERIFELLDTPIQIENTEKPALLSSIRGKIEFCHVWFAYDDENWVLQDVSFVVYPGQTIAFVGATGAGKSSIISLITRLYDIQKGTILIDDIPIKDLDKFELRRQIGVVLQDIFLFTGDIKENIRLNASHISLDQVIKSSQFVNANTFIQNLPQKYNEKVMERGATLSSGQRQLLAFARALVFQPHVLILDEATSSIDTETEALIQDAIEKITRDRTTLVVAHRLSTIQHADNIIVMHKGKIREIGTHQVLLSLQGMYYDLYMLQYNNN